MRHLVAISFILALSVALGEETDRIKVVELATITSTSPQADATTTTVTDRETTFGGDKEITITTEKVKDEDDQEPNTTTTDSLSVNLDESSTIVNGESSESLDEKIEAKSIDGNSNDSNRLNGKLLDSDTLKIEDEQQAGKESGSKSHLNMSQIDSIFQDGRKDEQEAVDAWLRMGKKLKKGIGGIVGSIVPYALNMSQEAKIGSDCAGAMLKWVLNMNQLKAWALKMLDASGKPIAGLLEGSLTMFGNYRQCLKVRAPDDDEIEFTGEFREYFRGKYCIIQIKPWLPEKSRFYTLNSKLKSLSETNDEEVQWYDRTIFDELNEWVLAFNYVSIRADVCVPSLCSREDIQKAVGYMLKGIDLKARVLRCETEAPDGSFGPAASVETSNDVVLVAASTNQPRETFSQMGWVILPVLAIAIVLVATAISMTVREDNDKKPTKLRHTIKSLSLKRSVSSHLNVDYDQLADDKPLSLYGIRFVLVLWVIIVESGVNLKFEYLRELLMLKDLIFWWPMQFVINSTMQFESIILLTAFTMGYKNCLNEGNRNAKAFTKYVLDKYIRLMPSIMLLVALVILLPLLYKGPVWNDYVVKQSAVCQSSGWLNIVFLQNYLPYKEICVPQTWLVCVELQLVLLMAPLVYYLNKCYLDALQNDNSGNKHKQMNRWLDARNETSKPLYWLRTLPGALLVGCIALGMGISFYNVYTNQLPPSFFYTMADPDSKSLYFSEHLMKLWTHLAVFAVGILAGVECRRAARNVLQGYRCHNISLASESQMGLGAQKSLSSSISSLPANIQSQNDSQSTRTSTDLNSSSISINIQTTSSRSSNIDSYETKSNWSSILIDVFCCLVAIITMTAIIFSTHDWSLNNLPEPLIAGIYDIGSRFLWSIAFIWILYTLSVPRSDGSFTPMAKLLGHPVMVSLGKLSFLIYIIHPFVHTAVLAIQEQPIYSSWLMLFHIMIGNITITVILASLVSLFVEMPCRNLFRRCGTSLLLTQTVGPTSTTGTT